MINHLIGAISVIGKNIYTRIVKMLKYSSGTACTPALTVIALTDNVFVIIVCVIDELSYIVGKTEPSALFFKFCRRPYINVLKGTIINVAAYSVKLYMLCTRIIKTDHCRFWGNDLLIIIFSISFLEHISTFIISASDDVIISHMV